MTSSPINLWTKLLAKAIAVAPEPGRSTQQVPPSATAVFVQAAKQLSEGLEEQGYPGPADSLLRTAKAVEKLNYLGGANLQAVAEALARAEKLPALAEDAGILRTAGRGLQETQRLAAGTLSGPTREANGPER